MIKKITITMLCFLSIVCLVGCSNQKEIDITYPKEGNQVEPRATFNNKFGEDLIPDQWEGYGIGDPFVLRFNGKYYLYASTKDSEKGIRAWSSIDLIHWEKAETEGLPSGYVTTADSTVGAYAPEVIYYNGYFYLVTSPGGNGHYILRSTDPLGPFMPISQNIGESIDGSFFLDDDEKMYFMRASNNGIRIVEVNTDDQASWILGTGRTLDHTVIGNWTEGPFMIKRNGIYYMTFTGNHVTSAGYRIAYATSTTSPFVRDAFTYQDTIALKTDEVFNGLGHSSTVLGPDLDAYYLAYHNLNSSGGPNRSFNLGRLLFNGTNMTINNVGLENHYVPAMPSFYETDATNLETNQNMLLSKTQHESTFSAEYNIKSEGSLLFGYQDEENYYRIDVKSKSLSLIAVKNSKEVVLDKKEFTKTYDMNVLHTIRVAYRDGKIDVYFDNMHHIKQVTSNVNAGKIGYQNIDRESIYTTIYSDVAMGLSDELEIKQSKVGANQYISALSNVEASNLTLQHNPVDENYTGYNGSYDLSLKQKGEYATYLYEISKTGFYGITMTLPKTYMGKMVGIQINDATGMQISIPNIETNKSYVTLTITQLSLPKGIHYIKIYNVRDEIAFNAFDIFESSVSSPQFSHDLSGYVLKGAQYVNAWKLKDGGHQALEGNRQLLYFGNETFTDVRVSVEVKFEGLTQTSTAGILLRANHAAFSVHDGYDSIQGYYIGFNNNKVFISKYNYNLSTYDISALAKSFDSSNDTDSDHYYRLTAEMKGNQITVYIDDQLIFQYIDEHAIAVGRVGLYTEAAGAIFKNLEIN